MQRWQTWLIIGAVCFASSTRVQAQNLFERLGRPLVPEASPAAPAPSSDLPEISLPETLPPPPSAPQSFTGRPTLGVTVDTLTDDIVRQRRLPVRSGALITAIVQSSPADQAGLPLGAVIVALDGRRIDSPADLIAAIRTSPIDRPIELSYYDGDRLYRKRLQLLSAPVAESAPTAPGPAPLRRRSSLEEQLGGQGQRPVLGRVGQLLDGIVAPASGAAVPPVTDFNEIGILREQVRLLQQELDLLRARLAAVERQLAERAAE